MQRNSSYDVELQAFADAIAERGWAITPPILDDDAVVALRDVVAPLAIDGRGGARNLLADNRIRALAIAPTIRTFACAILGGECFAVRALLFDKTPVANWKVVWHQDLTIAAREQAEVPGYGPWSEKAGVPHVQPPVAILEHMLALRIHLDPCGADNGPVRVLDGSHRLGRLSSAAIDELRRVHPERDCVVEQGGILAFRPLIAHASAPATRPGHRRVIHIEYASQVLPEPLAWHQRVA
jgi:ectoine hydroxylase-related dioxygenase (phytanoyl-CoA dioxygenase family)